jgi:hypothetical protein
MSAVAKFVPISNTELMIGLFENDKPCPEVKLDASDIDGLIAALAEFRSNMTPEISSTLSSGSFQSIVDPLWNALASPLLPGKIVAVRHPGYGWVGFQFPSDEAAKLGAFLSDQSTGGSSNPQTPTSSFH